MRERAILIGGKLQVLSQPNAGTDVKLTVPEPSPAAMVDVPIFRKRRFIESGGRGFVKMAPDEPCSAMRKPIRVNIAVGNLWIRRQGLIDCLAYLTSTWTPLHFPQGFRGPKPRKR